MSVGPTGAVLSSLAGAPLAQTQGPEPERARQDASAQQRRVESNLKSEAAAGIGQTDEDQETSERDADGRRPWEKPPEGKQAEPPQDDSATTPRPSKDASGLSGNLLDLSG